MTKLKKLFTLLLVASMLLAVGCSKNNESVENEGTSTEVTEGTSLMDELDLDYSAGLDENGFYTDVVAKDLVDLAEYQNISIPSVDHTITDVMIETAIDSLMSDHSTEVNTIERSVVDGDTVNIDYVGSVDGIDFDGGNTGGNGTDVTIGVTSYIDDFLEQLIGHSPGESFDIEVTFPEDYQAENLKGRDAVFAITINHIKETLSPELTDEFIAKNFLVSHNSNTLEELKATVKSDLEERAIKGFLLEYVIENSTITTLPEALLDFQKTNMENYYVSSAAAYQMTTEEFLSAYVGYDSLEAVYVAMTDQIKTLSESSLITQAIAEEANLEVKDSDLKAYFLKSTGNEDYSEFETIYGMPYVKHSLLNDLVLNYLKEMAVLEN